MTELLVASRNKKKLAELRRVLDAAGISGLRLLSLDDVAPNDEAPETGGDESADIFQMRVQVAF